MRSADPRDPLGILARADRTRTQQRMQALAAASREDQPRWHAALAADIASRFPQRNQGEAAMSDGNQQPDPQAEHADFERKVTESRDRMMRSLRMRIPAEPVRLPLRNTPPPDDAA